MIPTLNTRMIIEGLIVSNLDFLFTLAGLALLFYGLSLIQAGGGLC